MSKLLLLGPQTNINNPSKTGGTIVLFENLLTQVINQNISFILIDTNKMS